jgi:hypothetical protein
MSITPDSVAGVDVGTRVSSNTATVIAASSIHEPGDGMLAHCIVLAVTEQGNFVTWLYRLHDAHVFSGNYKPTIEAALAELYERCDKYRLNVLVGSSARPAPASPASLWRR